MDAQYRPLSFLQGPPPPSQGHPPQAHPPQAPPPPGRLRPRSPSPDADYSGEDPYGPINSELAKISSHIQAQFDPSTERILVYIDTQSLAQANVTEGKVYQGGCFLAHVYLSQASYTIHVLGDSLRGDRETTLKEVQSESRKAVKDALTHVHTKLRKAVFPGLYDNLKHITRMEVMIKNGKHCFIKMNCSFQYGKDKDGQTTKEGKYTVIGEGVLIFQEFPTIILLNDDPKNEPAVFQITLEQLQSHKFVIQEVEESSGAGASASE